MVLIHQNCWWRSWNLVFRETPSLSTHAPNSGGPALDSYAESVQAPAARPPRAPAATQWAEPPPRPLVQSFATALGLHMDVVNLHAPSEGELHHDDGFGAALRGHGLDIAAEVADTVEDPPSPRDDIFMAPLSPLSEHIAS